MHKTTIHIIIALIFSYFVAADDSRSNATEALRHCWDAGKVCDTQGVALANCNGLVGVDLTSCTCDAENLYTPPVLFPCSVSLSFKLVHRLSEDLRSNGGTELSGGLGCL
jgi:hypothetical protein